MWDPHLIKHIELLEKVQRFALQVCTKTWNQSYDTLLLQTQLPRLEQRRTQLKFLFLYQLVHDLAFCPQAPLIFRNMSVNVRNNNPYLLNRPICHSTAHYRSFFPHSISLWNNLPSSVTCLSSLYSFKCNVSKYLNA